MSNQLPSNFLIQFQRFHDWHFEIKAKLEKENTFNYLEDNFFKWEKEYRNEIEDIGKTTQNIHPSTSSKIKEFVKKSTLFKAYYKAPYYKQIIDKPRGYAGDSDMMKIIYRNNYEGSDLFSMFIHRLATECDACIAVRNRRTFLSNQIKNSSGKILSFAAGPALEIFDNLNDINSNNQTKSFLALDHDIRTIKDAMNENNSFQLKYGNINAFHLIKGNKKYLIPKKKSIQNCNPTKDLKGIRKSLLPFKYQIKNLNNEKFNFIYSAGLFDYIKTFDDLNKGTTALTKTLFNLLDKNGKLILGNFSDKNPIGIKWVMEYICDWNLIYRNETEITNFAKAIPKNQIQYVKIHKEEKEINYFLEIKKA